MLLKGKNGCCFQAQLKFDNYIKQQQKISQSDVFNPDFYEDSKMGSDIFVPFES